MKEYYNDYDLVLGGGGSRGLAHIGVLSVLEKIKKPSSVIGCSMGAIVGALYAMYADSDTVKQKIIDIIESKTFKKINIGKSSEIYDSFLLLTLLYRRNYLVPYKKMYDLLKAVIPEDVTFKELAIPLKLSAFEINNGKNIMLDSGNLLKSVIASMSIPGVVENVSFNKNLVVDGGVTGSVPYYALNRDKKNIVIDVSYIPEKKDDFVNALEIYHRSFEWQIYYYENVYRKRYVKNNNIYVLFPDVGKYQLKHFREYEEIIQKGKIETSNHKDEILNHLKVDFLTKIKKMFGYRK